MNVPVQRSTLLRLALIAAGSLSFASIVPVSAEPGAARLDVAAGLLVAVVVAVLLAQAGRRRRLLLDTVNLELNKLRRIYHLSKNLSETDPQRYRGWFTELHGNLYGYMMFFGDHDFGKYEQSNPEFRKVSYHVYTVPELESTKERSLYDDLLRTTGLVAESRQRIKELRESRISAYVWIVLLLMALGFVVAVVLSTADLFAARLACGISIAVALLAVDLLWEVDTLASERSAIAKRYAENIGRLELRRREDETPRNA